MTILRHKLVLAFSFVCVVIGVSSTQTDRSSASPTPDDRYDRGLFAVELPAMAIKGARL
jgi:hypothetical protein